MKKISGVCILIFATCFYVSTTVWEILSPMSTGVAIERSSSIQHQAGRPHHGHSTNIQPNEKGPNHYHLTREREMPQMFKTEPDYSDAMDYTSFKKILFWNDMYGKYHYSFGLGREPFIRAGCPFNKCITTSNRSLFPLSQIDALVWHFRSEDRELPSERSNDTRYVFLMQESPMNLYGDLTPYDRIFNWTFTYRLDSDFPSPAGFVIDRTTKLERLPEDVATKKTKMIAWFVSNCKSSSGRESLVRTLEIYLPVDIYGKCGQLQCKRSQQTRCYQMLERDYKFYLSFENSLCRDYITEKFFHILQYNIVPVVWGSANYSLQAPRHSFINANSFESIEDLATYLKYLNVNTTAYIEYFEWKRDYEVLTGWAASVRPWCDMCKRLHRDEDLQIYDNIHGWFSRENDCQLPTSSTIARFTHGERKHRDLMLDKTQTFSNNQTVGQDSNDQTMSYVTDIIYGNTT